MQNGTAQLVQASYRVGPAMLYVAYLQALLLLLHPAMAIGWITLGAWYGLTFAAR